MKKLSLPEERKRLIHTNMGSCTVEISKIWMDIFGKHSGWIQSDHLKNNNMNNATDNYIKEAPTEHRDALKKIRDILRDILVPLGYEE